MNLHDNFYRVKLSTSNWVFENFGHAGFRFWVRAVFFTIGVVGYLSVFESFSDQNIIPPVIKWFLGFPLNTYHLFSFAYRGTGTISDGLRHHEFRNAKYNCTINNKFLYSVYFALLFCECSALFNSTFKPSLRITVIIRKYSLHARCSSFLFNPKAPLWP